MLPKFVCQYYWEWPYISNNNKQRQV